MRVKELGIVLVHKNGNVAREKTGRKLLFEYMQ
jgi:hypothetical protein